jgi:hypothetical protein
VAHQPLLVFKFGYMQNKSNLFTYKSRREEIIGSPEYVIAFKKQQYRYRILYAVITGFVSVTGYVIKSHFFP